MRARSGLAAGLSALAAMTALAALAASLSLNGGSTTELASAKPAPKHALTQADKTRLYKSMMLQTFTSPQEARKIAGELGVPESEIPVQQLQQSSPSHHAKEEPMTPLEQKAAATRSHHSYTLHGLNVPYFSRSLHYQPPEGGSGMHAASAAYKKKLERQGIVDDNGHYLSAQQDKALSEELQGAIDTYASDELSDPTAPPSEGAPLTSRGDRVLAQQLNDGMAYAFLPNSGRAQQRPKILQGSARQELVHELVEGERDALIGEGAPAAPRTLGQRSAQQLVQALESGQRYADLPNFGRPVPRRAYEQGAQAVRREQQLVRDLTAGESFATVGAGGQGAEQRAVRQAWGIPADRRTAVPLTVPQDHNLVKYLHQGIREVFGSRQVQPPKLMSRAEGEALVRGAQEGALAEYEASAPRGEKFQTPQQALALSHSLSSTLKSYNDGQGHYVNEYLRSVRRGDALGRSVAWKPERGSEGVVRAGRHAEGAESARFAAQERVLLQGLKFERDARRDTSEAQAQAKGKKGWLNVAQGQALAKFLSPQASILPGQAPGLGYAV